MTEIVELVCKRLHMPWPNVRIPANMRVAIGPPELADALCARGFFEKVSEEILAKEREAEANAEAEKPPEPESKKKGK